jgi:predicted dehydrogenase
MTAPSPRATRLACVGCGYWGRNLIRNFLELPAAEVLGFCRANPDRLAAMAEQYPSARLYPTMTAVVADPDIEAVVIATPARTHYELAREALLAGKHVFVEKPMTLRANEAEALVTLADEGHRVLMVGHLLEYAPAVEALRDCLAEGRIGRVRHIHMERLKFGKVRSEENVLWSFAPHDISVMGFLLGPKARPREVRATGRCVLQPGIADIVHVDLTYPDEVTCHLHASWLHPETRRWVLVVGERGMLVWDDLAPEHKLTLHDKTVDLANLSTRDGGGAPVPFVEAEPLRRECEQFLACIAEGRTPRSDGRDGLRVVEVLVQATQALRR